MYTVGYRLLRTTVGKDWADEISSKCLIQTRNRLTIPYQRQKYKINRFYSFIGDDDIANKLIFDLGGQRINTTKYLMNTHRKITKKILYVLLSSGLSKDEIITVIRSDTEFFGYQNK